jgi:hypothetical protein
VLFPLCCFHFLAAACEHVLPRAAYLVAYIILLDFELFIDIVGVEGWKALFSWDINSMNKKQFDLLLVNMQIGDLVGKRGLVPLLLQELRKRLGVIDLSEGGGTGKESMLP